MVVTHDIQVNRVCYDSRRVARGDLFIAIRGSGFDGHAFVSQAVANGASVVVIEDDSVLPDSYFMHAGVVKIVVANTRVALARISANYFRHPSRELLMVGVTGTNGKTTTTHLIRSLLNAKGMTTGLIGTIQYEIGKQILPATHTTPESLELNELLAKMVEQHCDAAVMEVSSHALHQHRVEGIEFRAGVFTNLTQDHLDYHGTMPEYFNAKSILFESLPAAAFAVINVDDPWGEKMMTIGRSQKISYGTAASAEVRATDLSLSMHSTSCVISHGSERTAVESSLIGRFNVSNILAAFSTGVALGIEKNVIREAIHSTPVVRGRFEQIQSPRGWTAVVDYAHTPDALLKAITAVRDIFDGGNRGKLITVFGCGGNRDRTKRPQMGRIASEYSDIVVLTSDNPRHENPELILDEVFAGVKPGARVIREADRRTAIVQALSAAGDKDVVLIAGKGHEDYQVIGDTKIHFSDREVVEEFLRRAA